MENSFNYNYSAKENEEISAIREKYVPRGETKLDEMKKLDGKVKSAGMIEALCIGIIGSLIFGLGMCFAMQVLGTGALFTVLGVIIGILGAAVMIVAYPIYRKINDKAKEKYSGRILELISEIESKGGENK